MNPFTNRGDPSAGGPPRTPQTTDTGKVGRLARQFASEPELILAYLEPPAGGQPPDAGLILAAAQQAVAECPDYADLHYFAAHAALEARQPVQARRLLESALQLNPQYNAALILAARTCMVQGERDEALRYMRQALFNGADYADVHVILGDLWRERDELTNAREAYRRALQLNVNLATVREKLAALDAAKPKGGTDELPA